MLIRIIIIASEVVREEYLVFELGYPEIGGSCTWAFVGALFTQPDPTGRTPWGTALEQLNLKNTAKSAQRLVGETCEYISSAALSPGTNCSGVFRADIVLQAKR